MPEIEKRLPAARHEPSDIPIRATLVGLVLVGLVLVGIVLLPRYLFPVARDPTPASAPRGFAEPRLQPSPPADLQAFLAEEMQRLNGIGWIDRAGGIVHVPIADAMRRIAATGIADWPTAGSAR